ncbi:hypothetical protein [Sphingomonas sp. DC2300-3]|uniref:hypothetical protein n=1 Tax=unclassified Sphingomonas TaxID=196159 RepID=UPI003CE83E9D
MPRRLPRDVLRAGRLEQGASEHLDRQGIRLARDHQLTRLDDLAQAQRTGACIEGFQLGIKITGASHHLFSCVAKNRPFIALPDQRTRAGIIWYDVSLRKMKSSKGALIRRADVACEV